MLHIFKLYVCSICPQSLMYYVSTYSHYLYVFLDDIVCLWYPVWPRRNVSLSSEIADRHTPSMPPLAPWPPCPRREGPLWQVLLATGLALVVGFGFLAIHILNSPLSVACLASYICGGLLGYGCSLGLAWNCPCGDAMGLIYSPQGHS